MTSVPRTLRLALTIAGLLLLCVALLFWPSTEPAGVASDADDPTPDVEVSREPPAFLAWHEPNLVQVGVADTFDAAVTLLGQSVGHRITFEGIADGSRIDGWVDVDVGTGDFHAYTVSAGEASAAVASEYVLVGDRMSARIGGHDDFDRLGWDVIDVSAVRATFVDRNYTMGGILAPDLDRIAVLLRSVPFEAEATPDGANQIVRFKASDIAWFYREGGLEVVSTVAEPGDTVYEFHYGDRGALDRLVARGTHFHDGEALHGVAAEIRYTQVDRPQIQAPVS